jgi:mannose-6-phosphate isomerase-like protein (cupin superfamily)
VLNIQRKRAAPRYQRDNITSYLLVSETTCDAKRLSITLVEMAPGGVQRPHAHLPEQMYYILEGFGVMTVDGEEKPVAAGDCIFFPSQATHGLVNSGGTTLRYLSAASPSFTAEECRKLWPLKSLDEEERDVHKV